MSTVTKGLLSGSTDGKGIKVTTASPLDGSDTTIHTATSGTTDGDTDHVTIYAINTDAADVDLFIGWGGTTDPDHLIRQTIPFRAGLTLVVLDLPVRNSQVVVASASSTNKIVIYGHVKKVR